MPAFFPLWLILVALLFEVASNVTNEHEYVKLTEHPLSGKLLQFTWLL